MTSLLDFMNLFPGFRGSSWDGWRAVLARITPIVREFYGAIGRGAGKSRIAALIAVWKAVQTYDRVPGEYIYVGIFAPDRKQAGITFRYVVGLLKSVPALSRLIVSETRDSIELSTGVIIEVLTASTAAPRGRAYVLVILEEASFFPKDTDANPDVELYRAVVPGLARVPGSLLVVASSPYSRSGILYDAWKKYHDQPDGEVVFVQADTASLNPTFDARAIAKAYEDDPTSASAEYGGLFRSDVESFVSREAIDAVTVEGRIELPRVPGIIYKAFLDFAGGSAGGDSATLGIAHAERREGRSVAVLDALMERRPPFAPSVVCEDFALVLRSYGVGTATADRWAGNFPTEAMAKLGVRLVPSDAPKSDIYRDVLSIINSRSCELPDSLRLQTQLLGLERRTGRSGKDSIDHGPGGHDDVCNAALGAISLVSLVANCGLQRINQWTGQPISGLFGNVEYRDGRPIPPAGSQPLDWYPSAPTRPVPTVRIVNPNDRSTWVSINRDTFDESRHQLWTGDDASQPPAARATTVPLVRG
ncbi:MAG: hypothetical protein NTV05_08375 [Acidobacteria bacterium]|nr:hypothetical protein [Acidobacteriota bacterium]